jgi:hypothetical protein
MRQRLTVNIEPFHPLVRPSTNVDESVNIDSINTMINNNYPTVNNASFLEPTQQDIYRELSERSEFRALMRQRFSRRSYLIARFKDTILFDERGVEAHSIGNMDSKCIYCYAKFFKWERASVRGNYSLCCQNGDIRIPQITSPSPYMQELFGGDTVESKLFLKNPRKYNNHLSFASISMNDGKKIFLFILTQFTVSSNNDFGNI